MTQHGTARYQYLESLDSSRTLRARTGAAVDHHPFRVHLHGARSYREAADLILARARTADPAQPFLSRLLPELNGPAACRLGTDQPEHFDNRSRLRASRSPLDQARLGHGADLPEKAMQLRNVVCRSIARNLPRQFSCLRTDRGGTGVVRSPPERQPVAPPRGRDRETRTWVGGVRRGCAKGPGGLQEASRERLHSGDRITTMSQSMI